MAFNPDYGKQLRVLGMRKEARHTFLGFPLSSISALGDGKYSTMAVYGLGGVDHAASLDFDGKILADILRILPASLAGQIENLFRTRPAPVLIRFPSPVRIDFTTTLGEPVRVEQEKFIPLIIEEVREAGR